MCMDEEPVACTSEKAVTLTAVTQSHSSECLIPLGEKKKKKKSNYPEEQRVF